MSVSEWDELTHPRVSRAERTMRGVSVVPTVSGGVLDLEAGALVLEGRAAAGRGVISARAVGVRLVGRVIGRVRVGN